MVSTERHSKPQMLMSRSFSLRQASRIMGARKRISWHKWGKDTGDERVRSDCVCQNWHRGHPEAALNERFPSLVCVLPVVSKFQMKGTKHEKNEIHKRVPVRLYNRKMLLACPPSAAIHSSSALSSSALLPSMGIEETIVSLLSSSIIFHVQGKSI